jgi:GYF domain 2/Domain of unknown function (DUF4234)
MNYFIKRDEKEYGPYSLSDLQKYVASGNILLTDLCRSEGLPDWVSVSQVIGNIPVPVAAPQPGAGTVYGTPAAYAAPVSEYPPPPSLHWGICLLLGILTCGLFSIIWMMVQAVWVKKVQPNSKAVTYFGIAIGLWVLALVVAVSGGISAARTGTADPSYQAFQGLLNLGTAILWLVTAFNMRSSIEEHFNSAEPIGLSLNGVMTFFFNVYYFQYHFTRINEMKQRQMMGYSR